MILKKKRETALLDANQVKKKKKNRKKKQAKKERERDQESQTAVISEVSF